MSAWPMSCRKERLAEAMSRLTNAPLVASKRLQSSKMPAFTLYGARGSTNTDRVRLTLAEGGFTDYELVPLNLGKGEQKVRQRSFGSWRVTWHVFLPETFM